MLLFLKLIDTLFTNIVKIVSVFGKLLNSSLFEKSSNTILIIIKLKNILIEKLFKVKITSETNVGKKLSPRMFTIKIFINKLIVNIFAKKKMVKETQGVYLS